MKKLKRQIYVSWKSWKWYVKSRRAVGIDRENCNHGQKERGNHPWEFLGSPLPHSSSFWALLRDGVWFCSASLFMLPLLTPRFYRRGDALLLFFFFFVLFFFWWMCFLLGYCVLSLYPIVFFSTTFKVKILYIFIFCMPLLFCVIKLFNRCPK